MDGLVAEVVRAEAATGVRHPIAERTIGVHLIVAHSSHSSSRAAPQLRFHVLYSALASCGWPRSGTWQ